MDLTKMQYLEVNSIGIVMLLVVFFYIVIIQRDTAQEDQRLFLKMLWINATILMVDLFSVLLQGHEGLWPVAANHFMCITFFVLQLYFGYLWFLYVMKKLYPDKTMSCKQRVALALPCFLGTVLIVLSVYTKWIYAIEAGNYYQRGPYLWVLMVICYSYWMAGAIVAFCEAVKPKQIRETILYGMLIFFPLPTLIGALLQMKVYGLSVTWICAAISLLILFINLQNRQISRDILTGVYNRGQTNKQLLWECRHLPGSDYCLAVLMIDVNEFKGINDRFGHLAGDQALITVAHILRVSCDNQYFVGRFGGDEFVMLGHVPNEAAVLPLLQKIWDMAQQSGGKDVPCRLSLSIGYRLYTKEDVITIDRIIAEADEQMYHEKRAGKAQKDLACMPK